MKRVIEFLKEHKIETFVATLVIAFLFTAFVFIGITISHCAHTIDEAGGFRAVVIESGKEIKSIINDINEE